MKFTFDAESATVMLTGPTRFNLALVCSALELLLHFALPLVFILLGLGRSCMHFCVQSTSHTCHSYVS